jgi:hypothetical protein
VVSDGTSDGGIILTTCPTLERHNGFGYISFEFLLEIFSKENNLGIST